MANQSVSTPVFYIDYTQLAKAKGFFRNWTDFGVNNTNGIFEFDEVFNQVYGEKNMDVWNFDYTSSNEYTFAQGQSAYDFRLAFWEPSDIESHSLEWAKLLQTANWMGILNHNLKTRASALGSTEVTCRGYYWNGADLYPFDENDRVINYDGYHITEFGVQEDNVFGGDLSKYSSFLFEIDLGTTTGLDANIGSIAFGRKIEMPKSPDLNITKSVIYDGIKTKRSLGGSDYVQINNLGCPDWINGQPWSLTDTETSGRIGKNGRRSWELSFSHVSANDMFYDITKQSSFGEQNSVENPTEFYATNEVQQIYDLSLGGALSFIFQPNKNTDEFAICRIKQESFTTTQVASNVYNVSMVVEETW